MNPAEFAFAKLYAYRSYRNHHKNLLRKVSVLKSEQRFKEHPSKPPLENVSLFTKKDLIWFDYFYSINGIASQDYIPLRPYYLVIEPTLNHRLMVSTIKDKNFYDLFYASVPRPRVLLRRINGFFYDGSYERVSGFSNMMKILSAYDRFMIKPSLDSGSGQSIFLFNREGNNYRSEKQAFDENFLDRYRHDFVIQEVVRQPEYFKNFNPDSNNTLRVLVYRSVKDDSINILHTLLRIGAQGSYLDHDNLGGVSIAIDPEGNLAKKAYDGNGHALLAFNGISFGDQDRVPYVDEVWDLARSISNKTFYGRLLALDFTISEAGEVLLLDVNCWRNGISHYQMSNGSLFNEFTREVLEHCAMNPSFNIIRVPICNKR